jgi:hypothetical protein
VRRIINWQYKKGSQPLSCDASHQHGSWEQAPLNQRTGSRIDATRPHAARISSAVRRPPSGRPPRSSQKTSTSTLIGAQSGKCLEDPSYSTTNGTAVDLYTCNGGANQKRTVTDGGTVVGRQSGLCLDVTGQATANGSPLELCACNGGANQKWTRG